MGGVSPVVVPAVGSDQRGQVSAAGLAKDGPRPRIAFLAAIAKQNHGGVEQAGSVNLDPDRRSGLPSMPRSPAWRMPPHPS